MTKSSGSSTPSAAAESRRAAVFDRSVPTHASRQPSPRPRSSSRSINLRPIPSLVRRGHPDLVDPDLGGLVGVEEWTAGAIPTTQPSSIATARWGRGSERNSAVQRRSTALSKTPGATLSSTEASPGPSGRMIRLIADRSLTASPLTRAEGWRAACSVSPRSAAGARGPVQDRATPEQAGRFEPVSRGLASPASDRRPRADRHEGGASSPRGPGQGHPRDARDRAGPCGGVAIAVAARGPPEATPAIGHPRRLDARAGPMRFRLMLGRMSRPSPAMMAPGDEASPVPTVDLGGRLVLAEGGGPMARLALRPSGAIGSPRWGI
jgi:hypothetical protein